MALNIKRALRARGMNQKDLAQALHVSEAFVSAIANGNPSYTSLQSVAAVLDCDVSELFDVPECRVIQPLAPQKDKVTVGTPLARSVKRAIKSSGLKLKDVAELLRISPTALSMSINGSPCLSTIKGIATALHCDVWELLPHPTEPRLPQMPENPMNYSSLNAARTKARQSARTANNERAQRYQLHRELEKRSSTL